MGVLIRALCSKSAWSQLYVQYVCLCVCHWSVCVTFIDLRDFQSVVSLSSRLLHRPLLLCPMKLKSRTPKNSSEDDAMTGGECSQPSSLGVYVCGFAWLPAQFIVLCRLNSGGTQSLCDATHPHRGPSAEPLLQLHNIAAMRQSRAEGCDWATCSMFTQ